MPAGRDAGVRHHDVDAAEALDRRPRRRAPAPSQSVTSHSKAAAFEPHCAATRSSSSGSSPTSATLAPSAAARRARLGADAARRAGDQDRLAAQIPGHGPNPSSYEVRPGALAGGEPAARDGLLAGVELDGVGAVGVQVAEEAVLPAGEREERDRRGDADVDADHARVDLVAKAAHRGAVLGEDRDAVAEPRAETISIASSRLSARITDSTGPKISSRAASISGRPRRGSSRPGSTRCPRSRPSTASAAPSSTALSIAVRMRSRACSEITGPSSVRSSSPSPTRRPAAASRSGPISLSCASPTVTTTEPAMQRWPAAPKADPMIPWTVLSTTASGITTMWFFAPPSAWTRLPARAARS